MEALLNGMLISTGTRKIRTKNVLDYRRRVGYFDLCDKANIDSYMNTVTFQSAFERNDLHRSLRCDSAVAGRSVLADWVESTEFTNIARAFQRTIAPSIGGMIALIVLSSGMINLLLLLR